MYIEMIVQDNIFFIKKCFLFLNGSYIILINAVFGVFYRFNLFYLAFSHSSVSGGELFERVINDDFILTEKACVMFMRQICEGIEFMHNNSILHLDLKVALPPPRP